MVNQKILIIDGNQRLCDQFRERLQASGWSVLEAFAHTDVVELAQRQSPNVILFDSSLPQEISEAIANALKLDTLTCTIPIVVVQPLEQSRVPLEPWAAESTLPTVLLPVLLAKLQRALAGKHIRKPYVLVVDDEPDLVEILTALLNERGFASSGALDGTEALEIVRSVRPDAILLDLDMPKMNGWEFLKHMKAYAELQNIRIVILTGKDQSHEDRARGLSLGACEYLLKPCPPDEIVRVIHAALGTDKP